MYELWLKIQTNWTAWAIATHYRAVAKRFFKLQRATRKHRGTWICWGCADPRNGRRECCVALVALADGHWGNVADTAKFDEFAYTLLQDVTTEWPVFAVVKDSSNQAILSLFGSDGSTGTHTVDKLPALEEMRSFERLGARPKSSVGLWKIYTRLMQRFDAFHENVYCVTKDKVNDKMTLLKKLQNYF